MKKQIAILLALALLIPQIAGCANSKTEEAGEEQKTPSTDAALPVEEETEEPDPFAGVDFDGRTFSIYTSINTNMRFMLAGDYFIDLIRCTHCLIMNKNLYADLWGDPDDVYASVLEMTWTFDRYCELIEGAYIDLNGNGAIDKDDQFGHIAFQYWGPMIPWLISGDPGFIARDENGYPTIAVNNERSYLLTEKLSAILNNDATGIKVFSENE